ncbi:MAG: NAD(P)H-dependent glycerol-3-phosphate dehydrogenase [Calditrichota bacterium]
MGVFLIAAVLGAGSWGTTLALLLAGRGDDVRLWEFRPEAVHRMQTDRENLEFLPGHAFPPQLEATADLEAAVADAGLCILATPSHAMRSVAAGIIKPLPSDCLVVSAAKGLEEGSLMRMSEVVSETWRSWFDPDRFVALSGPSHAEEVVLGLPTSVVAASTSIESAHAVQRMMSTDRFRIYAHTDIIGVELGGALKNVIALAAGISAGLGFGDNTMGAILTRGLAEISRLGQKLGGQPQTFAGLSGMGDLITTCCSRHSRNRYVGEQLGQGRKLKDILAGMIMVAEGVRTTSSAWILAQREGAEMPITEQVNRILYQDVDPRQATMELMTRRLKIED